MASLSRKSPLQQCCWQLLEDLAFCSGRWPRLSALAAQVLFEQQLAVPAMPIDPELDGLLPFRRQPCCLVGSLGQGNQDSVDEWAFPQRLRTYWR